MTGPGEALERGLVWLEANAEGDHWVGFPTLAGRSDTWVTGFVVAHLAPLAPRSPLVARARRFLAGGCRAGGGWAYNPEVPADADSTAWCLAALARSRCLPPTARREAQTFLLRHHDIDGVRTFLPDSSIREYIRAAPGLATTGWTSPHPDVTAAALLSGAFARARARRALQSIAATQDRAGVLPAYWWRPPYYTAALTLRVFTRFRWRPPQSMIDGIAWLVERKQLEHGGYGLGARLDLDALSTALALECHAHLGRHGARERLRAAALGLVATQGPDGGWRGDLVLRIPAPDVVDPREVANWSHDTGGGNSFVPDRDGVFATTLACHALALYARVEANDYAGIADDWPVLELPDPAEDPDVEVVVNTWADEDERCDTPLDGRGAR